MYKLFQDFMFSNKKKYKIHFGKDYDENEDEDFTKLYMIDEYIEDIHKPDLILFDGKYYGEMKNNERHGQGVMKYTDGYEYIGRWENDRKNGFGIMNFGETSHYSIDDAFITEPKIYIGEFKEDGITGKGKLKYTNGFTYIGNFVNGRKNGYGLYYNKNIHYIGNWDNDDFKHGFIYKRELGVASNGISVYFTVAKILQNRKIRYAPIETYFVFSSDEMEYYI